MDRWGVVESWTMKAPLEITLPPEVNDASEWYGAHLVNRTEWIETLSEAELNELETAVHDIERSRIDPVSLTTQNASLPTLAVHLRELLNEVLHGRGFVLIKGLRIENWTRCQ